MSGEKQEAVIPTRPDWLATTREEAFAPELAIVDPHHHLWSRGGEPYFLPEFMEDAKSGHKIVSTIYMECHARYWTFGPDHLRAAGEVEFAAKVAEQSENGPDGTRVCAGIIGSADLRLGALVQEVLDAMVTAGRGRFRGVRQIAAWHPDPTVKGTIANPPPGLLLDEEFRRGMRVLAANGLTFDTWALHTQLPELYDLALAFPDLPIIMDHTGGAIGMGPYIGDRDRAFAEWRSAIQTLAKAPNAYAKIGGFGMRLWGFGFDQRSRPPSSDELAGAIRPYVETCIEAFGPDRCMFESNFPVDKGSYSYVVLWNAFKKIVDDYTVKEKNMLFRENSERVYSLI